MTTRDAAPVGAPCWTDLFTSDVEGSRRFYGELFGWEAQEPNAEFGGYFMFTRDGVPIAGGMGPMPDVPAADIWTVYLATDDAAKAAELAAAGGGQIQVPPMAVADLGTQSVLVDPTGARVGVWQPGTFPGFTVLDEPGAPSWFELHTRDYDGALAFYRSVFGWETDVIVDADGMRYSIGRHGDQSFGGVMDASGFLPEGQPAHWSVYWHVADTDATVAKAEALGGSVVQAAEDSPYGRLATLADPTGAVFKLRQHNP